ncbi:MAG: hypothetical protein JJT94_02880 [Bernardetiaceae bacterium]|nr:hypothetical protein [Bernardetiaceae bacterium]
MSCHHEVDLITPPNEPNQQADICLITSLYDTENNDFAQSFSYDRHHRLLSVVSPQENTYQIFRYANEQLTEQHIYTLDEDRLKEKFKYFYDNNHRIVRQEHWLATNANLQLLKYCVYSYNGMGELTRRYLFDAFYNQDALLTFDAFVWHAGNIVEHYIYDENSRVKYRYSYSYDTYQNPFRYHAPFVAEPYLLSYNNCTGYTVEGSENSRQPALKNQVFKYEYNNRGYPLTMQQNETQTFVYEYECLF